MGQRGCECEAGVSPRGFRWHLQQPGETWDLSRQQCLGCCPFCWAVASVYKGGNVSCGLEGHGKQEAVFSLSWVLGVTASLLEPSSPAPVTLSVHGMKSFS